MSLFRFLSFQISLVCALAAGPALAGDPVVVPDPDPMLWDSHRVDSHAPIGVMGEHTHEAGEFMFDYRWMYMRMDGHRAGTEELTTQDIYDLGYDMPALHMDMHMHMFMAMYGVTDWLTLMAMTNYIQMDMHMTTNPHAAHGHGGHGAHGGHGGPVGDHGHSSEGLGDTSLGALIKVYDRKDQRIHLNLDLVFPTAEVDQKQNGTFLPYGMQLGSGTWDLKPGITYLGQSDKLSWGAQMIGVFRLEEENESGFRFGDGANATTWVALPVTDALSVSARLNYGYQDVIEGHFNGPHPHSAPNHFQANYGGHVLDFGLGLNYQVQKGWLKGHRLAVEGLVPIYQDLNGVGMNRDYSIVVGWQKSW